MDGILRTSALTREPKEVDTSDFSDSTSSSEYSTSVESCIEVLPKKTLTEYFGIQLHGDRRTYKWVPRHYRHYEPGEKVLQLRHVTLGYNPQPNDFNVVEFRAHTTEGNVLRFNLACLVYGVQHSCDLFLDFDGRTPIEFNLVNGQGPVAISGFELIRGSEDTDEESNETEEEEIEISDEESRHEKVEGDESLASNNRASYGSNDAGNSGMKQAYASYTPDEKEELIVRKKEMNSEPQERDEHVSDGGTSHDPDDEDEQRKIDDHGLNEKKRFEIRKDIRYETGKRVEQSVTARCARYESDVEDWLNTIERKASTTKDMNMEVDAVNRKLADRAEDKSDGSEVAMEDEEESHEKPSAIGPTLKEIRENTEESLKVLEQAQIMETDIARKQQKSQLTKGHSRLGRPKSVTSRIAPRGNMEKENKNRMQHISREVHKLEITPWSATKVEKAGPKAKNLDICQKGRVPGSRRKSVERSSSLAAKGDARRSAVKTPKGYRSGATDCSRTAPPLLLKTQNHEDAPKSKSKDARNRVLTKGSSTWQRVFGASRHKIPSRVNISTERKYTSELVTSSSRGSGIPSPHKTSRQTSTTIAPKNAAGSGILAAYKKTSGGLATSSKVETMRKSTAARNQRRSNQPNTTKNPDNLPEAETTGVQVE